MFLGFLHPQRVWTVICPFHRVQTGLRSAVDHEGVLLSSLDNRFTRSNTS